MHLGIISLVAAVTFVAELPDKTLFAALILSRKFHPFYVWLGAAAALFIHVLIAVAAGHVLTLLPTKLLHLIVSALFLIGAFLIFYGKHGIEEATHHEPKPRLTSSPNFWKIFFAAFAIVFLGEWGDITQITTVNYAAHYHDTVNVALGAIIGLWAATALGVRVGSKSLKRIPAKTFQRISGTIFIIFAVLSAYSALK